MTFGSFRLNTLSGAVTAALNATGGTITYNTISSTPYKIHTFTTTGSNNFVTTGAGTADLLLVGGGGGGGGNNTTGNTRAGGGGGGGQVVSQTSVAVTAQTYTIVVGTGGTAGTTAGTAGGKGVSSTALGYTAEGGGGGGGAAAGAVAGAGGNAGGGGAASVTNTSGATGTLAGGNMNASSSTVGSSGGGGSNTSIGGNSSGTAPANGIGGTGGAGVASTITGSTTYYASGAAGRGSTNGTVTNSGVYGNGGQGGFSSSSTFSGSFGSNGVAIVRYPISSYVGFITSGTSTSSTIAVPALAQAGDFAILIDCATQSGTTAPTTVIPSGWTTVALTSGNDGTNAGRTQFHYKFLVSGDLSTTITGQSTAGTMDKMILIYRTTSTSVTTPSGNFSSYSSTNAGQGGSTTNGGFGQAIAAPGVAFAVYHATPTAIAVRNGANFTRELNSSTRMYVKTWERSDPTIANFSDTTVSLGADYGLNGLYTSNIDFN